MNRIISLVLFIILLFCFTACGGKKQFDAAGLKAKNTLSVLSEMSKSYEKKSGDFFSHISPTYRNRTAFVQTIQKIFDTYETIHFNIQQTKMLMVLQDKNRLAVTCNWAAEWIGAGGTSIKNDGRITFILDPNNFQIIAIEGKNPFIPQQAALPVKQ
ncbi:MAG: hypothetical protein WC539_03210 [Nitrospirota bacterium]